MVQKMGHHAVCERNLRKLLLNNGFILVECNYMPELEYRDDKELISFAILFVLNILCDVIHDVIHKHVYDWRIWLIGKSDSFGNDWLQLLQRRMKIMINVLGTVDTS